MTIEQRLEKLEQELTATKAQAGRAKRRNRYLLAAGGLCLAIGLVVWGLRKDVCANRFVLEDTNGKPRAVLSATKEGAGLVLSDARGKVRAGLVVDNKDGVRLRMYGKDGKGQAKFDVDKDGASLALELSEKAGTTAAALQVFEDGTPRVLLHKRGKSGADLNVDKDAARLLLLDEKGNPRVGLDLDKDTAMVMQLDDKGKPSAWVTVHKGVSGLFLSDPRPRSRAALTVGKGGVSVLSVYGEKITQEARLGASKDWVDVSLSDGRGDSRVTLSVGRLEVCDEKGKCIWSAPP